MTFDVRTLSGMTLVDASGHPIGKVAQVYLDDGTGEPEWVTVRTGLFGTKESFVPLAATHLVGDKLAVDASKDVVSGAPQVDQDGHLTPQEEVEIYRYYGLVGAGGGPEATSAPRQDDAMTRSEEHLVAGTQREATERVRLRKYVVTEMKTVQVPVRREEVRLEHQPITDAEREAAYAGGSVTDITEVTDASDEDRAMILRAERPVVTTETVAVERVRLGKETVTGTETVSGEVRKEQIELEESRDE